MSDRWIHSGGSAWLDAVLYDDVLWKTHRCFDGDFLGAQVDATSDKETKVVNSVAGSP